jgi:hypothetical protein
MLHCCPTLLQLLLQLALVGLQWIWLTGSLLL